MDRVLVCEACMGVIFWMQNGQSFRPPTFGPSINCRFCAWAMVVVSRVGSSVRLDSKKN